MACLPGRTTIVASALAIRRSISFEGLRHRSRSAPANTNAGGSGDYSGSTPAVPKGATGRRKLPSGLHRMRERWSLNHHDRADDGTARIQFSIKVQGVGYE
jgi:hypothetical protein